MRSCLLLLLAAAVTGAAVPPETAATVRALLRDRQIVAAASAAQALVAAHPVDAEAHALLALVRVAQGDADGGIAAAEKAVALAPESSELQRQLGDTYGFAAQQAGMFAKIGLGKKCLAAYARAVELDPANLDARGSLMTACQQAPAVMGGGMDKAYAQAAEIRKLDAHRGRVAYAQLFLGERKYTEAFAALEEVMQAAPDHYPALYQFGRAAALSGSHIDRGIAALERCLALPPAPGSPGHDAANWRLGNLWEKKGDKAAARAAYRAALAIKPDYQQALDSLAQLN